MNKFIYYGLFLTEDSREQLIEWLANNDFLDLANKSKRIYLDHCTLMHISQYDIILDGILETMLNTNQTNVEITVNGIGLGNKAMAFRVIDSKHICSNKIPHITIGTFKDGKPVDSNYIKVWKDIEPIKIKTILKRI